MDILGVPAEDEPRMLMLTQQLFGSTDPELNRGREAIKSTEQAIAMLHYVIADFESYFRELTADRRSEEHTSELQSLMRISYAVFCLKKKTQNKEIQSKQQRTRQISSSPNTKTNYKSKPQTKEHD